MKRKVYIFNGASRAAAYGIGTYIGQLTDSLKIAGIDFEVVHLYAGGREVAMEEKGGYRQISIPAVLSTTAKSPQYYIRNAVCLLKELIPEDIDVQYIFHLNFMTNPSLVTLLKKMFKCKVITTVHYTNWGFSLLGNEKRLKTILSENKTKLGDFEKQVKKDVEADKKMLGKSDRYICVAQHTLDSFRDICGIDIENGTVINNALKDVYKEITPVQKALLRKKYHIPVHTQVVMFAGRLDEAKGISSLVDAFKKVVGTNPDTRLVIAGDGDYNKWLSVAGDCWTKITFTGRLNKKQLYEFYRIADVGVVCSLYEEFGYVAIEMMMHGIPLVVTDTGGLAEIVEEGACGYKVQVRNRKEKRIVDVNAMADRIRTLLDNPALAKEFGKNGRKRFLEKYELVLFSKKMVDLYMQL